MKSAAEVRVKLLSHASEIIDRMLDVSLHGKGLLADNHEIACLRDLYKSIAPRISLADDNFVSATLSATFADKKIPAYQKSQEVLDKVLAGEISPTTGKILIEFTDTVFSQQELDRVLELLDDDRIKDRTKGSNLRVVK